jgi:hypothetical protein
LHLFKAVQTETVRLLFDASASSESSKFTHPVTVELA